MNDHDHEASTEIEQAERLLRAVCPDLRGIPLYLIDAKSLTGNEAQSVAYACTSVSLDLTLKPFCQWRGRGIGILVSLATIREDNVDLIGLLVHEVSHALADGFLAENRAATPATSAETVGQLAACRRLFERTERNETDAEYQTEVSDVHHSARWQRTILHMRYRLDQAGYTLGLHELLAPDARIHDLHTALLRANEYERFADLPFSELLCQPLPAGI